VTLLQPWAAAAAGGAGLAVLTLLYILKLRRRSLRVGSTMLWEQALAEVEVNSPWRKLRFDWLFVLQALAIAALAVAIGRPAVGIGSARQRVVVVIDASASMAATDGGEGRTRLEEAKRQAAEMIENLRRARGGALEAAVVSLAGPGGGRVVRGFTRESAGVLEGIDEIRQTDEPGDLAGALELIGTLTAGSDEAAEEDAEGTVAYIFSDGGFEPSLVAAPARATVDLVRTGPDPSAPARNAGITALSARRDDADPATVRVVARLLSTFPAARDVALRLLLDGSPAGSSAATLTPGAETAVIVPIGVRTGGVLTVRIMNDDVLLSDNAAHVVIDGPREPSVVVVAPGPQGRDADPLVVNFAQSVSAASRTVGVESLSAKGPWSSVDLIVFDRVEPRAGTLPPVASVSLGAGLATNGVTVVPAPAGAGTTERIVSWKRDHPLMRDVVLDTLVLKRPGTLSLPSGGVALAEGTRGPLVGLVEGNDGVGRVVCAFGAEQGGWGADLSFVVFMGNAMDYLTLRGRAKTGRQVSTGGELSVRAPVTATELVLTGPDAIERRIVVPPAEAGSGPLRTVALGRADRSGVYTVVGAAEGEDRIAVNVVSATESRVATADALPLRRGGSAADVVVARTGRPREVWDWFVLGGLAVLGVEWLVYAVLARK